MITIEAMRTNQGPNKWHLGPIVACRIATIGPSILRSKLAEAESEPLVRKLLSLPCTERPSRALRECVESNRSLPHLVVDISVGLQRLAGPEVEFGCVEPAEDAEHWTVVVACEEESVGAHSVRSAVHLANTEPNSPIGSQLGHIVEALQHLRFFGLRGVSAAIVEEARRRRIPVRVFGTSPIVELGQGKFTRQTSGSLTDLVSATAVQVTRDTVALRRLLASAGIPVPPTAIASSDEEIAPITEAIGLPVIVHSVSPANSSDGRRQVIDDENVLRTTAPALLRESGRLLIEKHVLGVDFAVLVIGGSAQSVIECIRNDTIAHSAAISEVQRDGTHSATLRTGAGLTARTRTEHIAEMHPENRRLCERAAELSRIPIASVIFRSTDLGSAYWENGGVIIGIDANPNIDVDLSADNNVARKAAQYTIDMLFPPGSKASIPIVAITGTNGKTTTARLLAHILRTDRRSVGLNTTNSGHVDHRVIYEGSLLSALVAPIILSNSDIDVAIFEETQKSILVTGLPYQEHDIGIVTNVSSDHLGTLGVTTLAELARVKSVVASAVTNDGFTILNAEDPLVYSMRHHTRGRVVLFSNRTDGRNEPLDAHLAEGGIAACIDDKGYVLLEGLKRMPIAAIREVPLALNGKARLQHDNILAALAAAYVSGVSCQTIRAGLLSFLSSWAMNPGRMNIFEVNGVTVLVDYAHNKASLEALVDCTSSFGARSRICVIGLPADRRDEDIIACGTIAASFDHVIVRERDTPGPRPAGEVARLLVQGIDAAGMQASQREIILSERLAVSRALTLAKPNDLVVLLACNLEEVVEQTLEFGASVPSSPLRHPTAPIFSPRSQLTRQ